MWNKASQAHTQQEGQPTRRNTHRKKDNQQDKHTHIGTRTNWKKDAQVGSRRNKEERAGAEEEGGTFRREDISNDNL